MRGLIQPAPIEYDTRPLTKDRGVALKHLPQICTYVLCAPPPPLASFNVEKFENLEAEYYLSFSFLHKLKYKCNMM